MTKRKDSAEKAIRDFRRATRRQYSAEAARSDWLDDGGIHYMPGHSWIYNPWGRDCEKLHLGDKKVRIGTDDVEGHSRFVKTRVG